MIFSLKPLGKISGQNNLSQFLQQSHAVLSVREAVNGPERPGVPGCTGGLASQVTPGSGPVSAGETQEPAAGFPVNQHRGGGCRTGAGTRHWGVCSGFSISTLLLLFRESKQACLLVYWVSWIFAVA